MMNIERAIKRRFAQDAKQIERKLANTDKRLERKFCGHASAESEKGKADSLAPSLKSNRPERYAVTEKDGCPAVEVRWPDGRREIAAVMVNTDFGHELAEMVCEHRNYASIVL